MHGPPRGYGDFASSIKRDGQYEKTGSPSLTKRIYEINPKLVVGGHIHSGYGVHTMENGTKYIGASVVNEKYELVNQPIVLEINAIAVPEEDLSRLT